ncbi:hypothetical protein EVAR_9842_1 [Eumeta japonica]|uniref:Uncharacterized protein n=1 Tax=Eumeta variegata TaxID=151549 RepID=A0A4C1TQ56_EUMVA|nr:hypothetical protein EVAR_9842_1 [Eumeta japonica]
MGTAGATESTRRVPRRAQHATATPEPTERVNGCTLVGTGGFRFERTSPNAINRLRYCRRYIKLGTHYGRLSNRQHKLGCETDSARARGNSSRGQRSFLMRLARWEVRGGARFSENSEVSCTKKDYTLTAETINSVEQA